LQRTEKKNNPKYLTDLDKLIVETGFDIYILLTILQEAKDSPAFEDFVDNPLSMKERHEFMIMDK